MHIQRPNISIASIVDGDESSQINSMFLNYFIVVTLVYIDFRHSLYAATDKACNDKFLLRLVSKLNIRVF